MQITLDDAQCSDGCLHLGDVHVSPLARMAGAVREGTSSLGVKLGDVPVMAAVEVVSVSRPSFASPCTGRTPRHQLLENG